MALERSKRILKKKGKEEKKKRETTPWVKIRVSSPLSRAEMQMSPERTRPWWLYGREIAAVSDGETCWTSPSRAPGKVIHREVPSPRTHVVPGAACHWMLLETGAKKRTLSEAWYDCV